MDLEVLNIRIIQISARSVQMSWVIDFPRPETTRHLTLFSNWRALPGQVKLNRFCKAAGVNCLSSVCIIRQSSVITQNRPLVITSKPANGRSVRDIDSAAKPFRLARHEQCLERRETTTSHSAWAARMVACGASSNRPVCAVRPSARI